MEPNQFLLMSLDGLIYPHLIEQSRLKAETISITKGNVNNLADLRKALSTGLSIEPTKKRNLDKQKKRLQEN